MPAAVTSGIDPSHRAPLPRVQAALGDGVHDIADLKEPEGAYKLVTEAFPAVTPPMSRVCL